LDECRLRLVVGVLVRVVRAVGGPHRGRRRPLGGIDRLAHLADVRAQQLLAEAGGLELLLDVAARAAAPRIAAVEASVDEDVRSGALAEAVAEAEQRARL